MFFVKLRDIGYYILPVYSNNSPFSNVNYDSGKIVRRVFNKNHTYYGLHDLERAWGGVL